MTDHHPRVEAAMNALYNVPVHDPTSALGLTERMTLAVIRAVDNYDITHKAMPTGFAPYVPLQEYQQGMQLMVCPNPLCGCEQVHLDIVEAFASSDSASKDVSIAMSGEDEAATIAVGPTTMDPGFVGRRHSIVLVGWCEWGHRFALVFRQHKGDTQVECSPLDNEEGYDEAPPWPAPQTW